MSYIQFSNQFYFMEYTFSRQHYTDRRDGSPRHYLACMEQGHCRIVSEQHTIEAGPGDAFYIPMGLPYQSWWDGNDTIRFRSYGFNGFPEATANAFCLQRLPGDPILLTQLASIPLGRNPDSAALGAFFSVLARLLPLMMQQNRTVGERLVETATRYFSAHPHCLVSEAARHCCVSESALYAAFRQVKNQTPNDVRQELLMETAIQLLTSTDKSIQEISDTLQFSSTSYFRKILKQHTRKSPREIRKNAFPL